MFKLISSLPKNMLQEEVTKKNIAFKQECQVFLLVDLIALARHSDALERLYLEVYSFLNTHKIFSFSGDIMLENISNDYVFDVIFKFRCYLFPLLHDLQTGDNSLATFNLDIQNVKRTGKLEFFKFASHERLQVCPDYNSYLYTVFPYYSRFCGSYHAWVRMTAETFFVYSSSTSQNVQPMRVRHRRDMDQNTGRKDSTAGEAGGDSTYSCEIINSRAADGKEETTRTPEEQDNFYNARDYTNGYEYSCWAGQGDDNKSHWDRLHRSHGEQQKENEGMVNTGYSGNGAHQRAFICNFPGCKKVYASATGLRYHMLNGHLERVVTKEFSCTFLNCDKSYKTKNGLAYHLIKFHNVRKAAARSKDN